MKKTKEIAEVLRALKPGDKIYTSVSHVSQSGMLRRVRVFIVDDGEIRDITGQVARAIDHNLNNQGIKMVGCGYDVTFEIVYSLGRVLFPSGSPCVGEGICLSNDHLNGDRDYTLGKIHKDGGYSFKNIRI